MGLTIQNVSRYFGKKPAVHDLSLSIPTGGILGLLGQNGAGKTTTIRMILGLLKPDQGEILWNGQPINREKLKIGYLPEERGLYPKDKVFNQLKYFGKLEGLSPKESEMAVDHWLEKLNMTQYRNMQAGELSKGNQQKIQLIAAVLHDPDLVILDEPFSGLDPLNTELLKDVIKELIHMKKTIIFSSHRMENTEEFCEDICLLKNGEIVLSGNLSTIKKGYGYKNLYIEIDQDIDQELLNLNIEYEKFKNQYRLKVHDMESLFPLTSHLLQSRELRTFTFKEPSLNQIFLEKVGG